MNAEFDWEWQGINFLSPLAFTDPLIIRVVPDIFAEYKDEQLDQMFAVMVLTSQHTYQVLTKRPKRMLEYLSDRRRSAAIVNAAMRGHNVLGLPSGWFPAQNIWLGVTVESQATADKRIPLLLQTPAAVRFLSCEPLLEGVNLHFFQDCPHCDVFTQGCPDCYDTGKIPLNAEGIDWVIVGGESGHNARPCDVAWIHSIVEQCKEVGVACFVKQLGTHPVIGMDSDNPIFYSASAGKGNNPDEWPEYL